VPLLFQQLANEDVLLAFPENVGDGAWAEIATLLLSHGGTPHGKGVAVQPLALRLAAEHLADTLARHSVAAEYDEATRLLLLQHLAEVRARREAEADRLELMPEEVHRQVSASGRFARTLTTSQIRDLGRLLRLMHGANFSVPGAGKTATLLACYEAARGNNSLDRLLVVAPKNAFLSWEEEVRLCYPRETPVVARVAGGTTRALDVLASDPEIALITYQFLPNVVDAVRSWVKRHATHVVLDESHRIKAGQSGVYAFAALQVSPIAVRRDILSGTPLPNSPEDLRAQIEFLWPGQRIMPDQRVRATPSQALLGAVQQSVQPFYVRTTKAELGLPALEPRPIGVTLGPLQQELYELLRSEAKRMASGFEPNDVRLLRRLGAHVLTLLEVATNPMLLAAGNGLESIDENGDLGSAVWELLREIGRREKPAKVQKAIEIAEHALENGRTHKVLMWTSFVQNVLLLEKLMERHKPVVLYGAVATGSDEDADTREGRIRAFHEDPECRVMIANPAACGEGISLHRACHHAIYLDRTFNAAHYLQSIDRIHRLGLSPEVETKVEILEARGTIDSRVAKRLKAKIDSMSQILNDPGLAALAYDPLDVIEEFPAGIQPEDVEEIVDHLITGEKDPA
jgi:SNF2 family DNA or RNA helicase